MLKTWNVSTGKVLGELKCSDLGVITAKLNPVFYTAAVSSKDKRLTNYDLEQFKMICETVGDPVKKMEYDQTGKYLFTATDTTVRVSNAETLNLIDSKELPGRKIDDLLLNSSDKSLYMISTNAFTFNVVKAEIGIFNLNTSQELDVIPTHERQRSEEPMSDVSPVYQNNVKKADSSKDVMKFKANIITTKNENEPMMDEVPKDVMKESINIESFLQMDSSKSISMISQLLEQHLKIKQALQRRKNNALTLLSWWDKSNGDLSPTLKALITMNDIATISDFFNFTFAIGLKVDSLTMDNLADIVPLIGKLLNTKYESFIVTGLKTLDKIYKSHSENIIQAKAYPNTCGVDLAREERMKKYDQVVGHLLNICDSSQFQGLMSKQGEIGIITKQIDKNLHHLKDSYGCNK